MSEANEIREYYEDRTLKAVYTIKDGKKEGLYSEFFQGSDQIKAQGNFVNDQKEGKWTTYDGYGMVTVENYKEGKLDGTAISSYRSKKTECSYSMGELTHETRHSGDELKVDMAYKNGKEWSGFRETYSVAGINHDEREEKYTLKDGQRHGDYYLFDFNGDQIKAHYTDGVLNGNYLEVRGDTRKEGIYTQGVFSGSVKQIKETHTWLGDVQIEKKYENDELISTDTLDPVNKVHLIERPNGICEEYNIGQWGAERIAKRYEQKNGVKDGSYEEFAPEGWRTISAGYKDGQLNGFCHEFYSDGKVAATKRFKEGKNVTAQYEALKEAAAQNVSADKETVTPKQSKISKAILGLKMKLKSGSR